MSVHKRILNKRWGNQRAYCEAKVPDTDLSEWWAKVTCKDCLKKMETDPVQQKVVKMQSKMLNDFIKKSGI